MIGHIMLLCNQFLKAKLTIELSAEDYGIALREYRKLFNNTNVNTATSIRGEFTIQHFDCEIKIMRELGNGVTVYYES